MNQILFNTGELLVEFIIGFFALAVLIRFIMQAVRASFYNPIGQFTIKFTNPVLVPMRKVIPSAYGYDLAGLVLLFLLELIKVICIFALRALFFSAALFPNAGIILGAAFIEILNLVINFYTFAIFMGVLASWVISLQNHPMMIIINQIINPLLRPFQRFIPAIGGLDLSPIFALLALQLIKIWVIYPLSTVFGHL
jgi:YggT family protein